jgi:hypothetical protein
LVGFSLDLAVLQWKLDETHCLSSTELDLSSAVKSITPLRKNNYFFK